MSATFDPPRTPVAGACWVLLQAGQTLEESQHYSLLMVGPGVDVHGEPVSLVAYRPLRGGQPICCAAEAFEKVYVPCRIHDHYQPVALAHEAATRQWLRDVEQVSDGLAKLVGATPSGVGPYLAPFQRLTEAALQKHVAMDAVQGLVRAKQKVEQRLQEECRLVQKLAASAGGRPPTG